MRIHIVYMHSVGPGAARRGTSDRGGRPGLEGHRQRRRCGALDKVPTEAYKAKPQQAKQSPKMKRTRQSPN